MISSKASYKVIILLGKKESNISLSLTVCACADACRTQKVYLQTFEIYIFQVH